MFCCNLGNKNSATIFAISIVNPEKSVNAES